MTLLISLGHLSAQTTLITDIVDPAQQNKDLLYNSSDKFVGSIFLFDEFHTGQIILHSGQTFENLILRYNVFNELIHFKKLNDDEENVVKNAKIAKFSFYVPSEATTYQFIQLQDVFFQIIYKTEEYTNIKKHFKKLIEGVPANGYNSGGNETLDRLIDTSSYYLLDNQSKVTSDFSMKKKDLYEFLISKGRFEDKKDIKKFQADNSIDITTDAGLKKALDQN